MCLACGEVYLRIYLVHKYALNANLVQASGWHREGGHAGCGLRRPRTLTACQVLRERSQDEKNMPRAKNMNSPPQCFQTRLRCFLRVLKTSGLSPDLLSQNHSKGQGIFILKSGPRYIFRSGKFRESACLALRLGRRWEPLSELIRGLRTRRECEGSFVHAPASGQGESINFSPSIPRASHQPDVPPIPDPPSSSHSPPSEAPDLSVHPGKNPKQLPLLQSHHLSEGQGFIKRFCSLDQTYKPFDELVFLLLRPENSVLTW